MKNKHPAHEWKNLIARVIRDKHGRTRLLYSFSGLLLKTQIIEKLITQHSKN
jgi:hypothetical protein